MNRVIKFRGKMVDTKEWVYGDLMTVNPSGETQYTTGSLFIIDSRTAIHCVIPESVGQFTGLKDKNGKEIFEGDVVRAIDHPTGVENITADVVFTLGSFGFINSIISLADYGTAWVEIIGNTFDNPELLKQ